MKVRIGDVAGEASSRDGEFDVSNAEVKITMSDGTVYIIGEDYAPDGGPELTLRSWTGALVIKPTAGNSLRIGQ